MHVFEFLNHHFLILNLLRLTAFLPNLIVTILLMTCLLPLKLRQYRRRIACFEQIDDLPCSERFEISHFFGKILCFGYEVEMIFENDVPKKTHASLLLKELPGIVDDLYARRSCEHWQPSDYSAGEKIRMPIVEDSVSSARHEICPKGTQRGTHGSASCLIERDAERPTRALPRRAW